MTPPHDSFFRSAFEDSGLAMIATDRDLTICSWNASAARMFGAERSLMLGTQIQSVLPSEQRATAVDLLRRAVATREYSDLEFQYRDERGAARELMMTISPVLGGAQGTQGAAVIFRDITKRIKLQKERLDNRKMAALGHMAGAMAHYFNNILGGIVTSVDFAMGTQNPETHIRVLQQTSRALARATHLLSGLLVFAEGNQREEHLSDYTEVVLSIADDVEPTLEPFGIRLQLNVPSLPVIPVPRVQLTTVLRSIVKNAVDAMPEGGTLTIECELAEGRIQTRISDTGCGMNDDLMSRLFEPFFSTKSPLGSTPGRAPGLSLAIAHGIMQVLGGSITATSAPGHGTTFAVSLPLQKPEA